MECLNPGGTGKDRAALNMILDAERRGDLPPPLLRSGLHSTGNGNELLSGRIAAVTDRHCDMRVACPTEKGMGPANHLSADEINYQYAHSSTSSIQHSSIPHDIHNAIVTALHGTRTNGIIIEGTSGSTGISLASLSCSRGHGVVVIMPDDQSSQKIDFLKRLGAGVVVVHNCSISNPGHYVNVARRVLEWLQVERRYDDYYWKNVFNKTTRSLPADNASQPPKLIQAAFMNQFENLANVRSHYMTTGPEIWAQLHGKVDAFVMSAGTGGTIVGVGGYLKEKWWHSFHAHKQSSLRMENRKQLPKIILVDPPGSSLFNKVKHGVAYAPQQSEKRLRRHRYDTIAEGIGLDRVTANFALGCEGIVWEKDDDRSSNYGQFRRRINMLKDPNAAAQPITSNTQQTNKIIDDALSISDQQAVYMAHYLLRHEGLFVGSSTAMNLVGALVVASEMPANSNIVTIVCDGGQRHTSRFWNRDFIVEQGLIWPGESGDFDMLESIDILERLSITSSGTGTHDK